MERMQELLTDIENRLRALTERLDAYHDGATPTTQSLNEDRGMARAIACQVHFLRIAIVEAHRADGGHDDRVRGE